MQRGQAFDAFKLLIAAVVAGAILVILIQIIQGVAPSTSDPSQVMRELIQSTKGTPGSAKTSGTQVVTFEADTEYSADGIAQASGLNPGTAVFCGTSTQCTNACKTDYQFDTTAFTVAAAGTDSSLTVNNKRSGVLRVFNCGTDGKFYIGFKLRN